MENKKQTTYWKWWQLKMEILLVRIAIRININAEMTIILLELIRQWLE